MTSQFLVFDQILHA